MIKTLILSSLLIYNQNDSLEFLSPAKILEKCADLEANKSYSEAIALYESVSANDTSYIEIAANLMATYNEAELYEKSREIGIKLKDLKSPFRKSIYISLGNAYLNDEKFEEGRVIYEEGLMLFPKSYVLLYNIGLSYYKEENYPSAATFFQRCLDVQPFYSSAHLMLAYISVLEGHRTKATFGYLTYLALNPDENETLLFLERLINGGVQHEGSIEPIFNNDSFDHLDDLLRSFAALDSRFKSKVYFNASLVKQTELLLSKLKYQEHSADFWMELYVPFYQQLDDAGLTAAFLYYILSSTEDDHVLNWISKHAQEKSAWIDLANDLLAHKRTVMETTIADKTDLYSHWYYSSNEISAIGNQIDDDTRTGPWEFFNTESQLTTKGQYSQTGDRIGKWSYYNDSGILTREEYYDNNGNHRLPATYYHENGNIYAIAHYDEDNELDSLLSYYYECGQLKELVPYKGGTQNGRGQLFHESGELKLDYTLTDDELVGDYIYYHKNGQKSDHYIYEKGMLNGAYVSYFPNGNKSEEGIYKNDSLDGQWSGYYPNGHVRYRGMDQQDEKIGKWIYYHTNGKIRQEEMYKKRGKLDGEVLVYDHRGVLSQKANYLDGKQTGYTFYDTEGHKLSEADNPDGNMPYLSYYVSGEKFIESQLVGGEYEGTFKSYFRNGRLLKEGTMKNGEFDGAYREYFKNGQLHISCNYAEGKRNGYFKAYHNNGQLAQEGWYVNDEVEQEWKIYYPDGSLDEINYFINGNLHGWSHTYGPNNVLHESSRHDMGTLMEMQQYDSLGKMYHSCSILNETGMLVRLSVRGDTISKSKHYCGAYEEISAYYATGQTMYEYVIQNHMKHGAYKSFNRNGTLRNEGAYANNLREGDWKWYYDNGQLESYYPYINDEIHGTVKHYTEDGNPDSEIVYYEGAKHGTFTYFDVQTGKVILRKLYDKEAGFTGYLDNQTNDTIPFMRTGTFTVRTAHDNGSTAATQEFLDDQYHGSNTYYFENGNLSEVIRYKHGELHGAWETYYADGKLKSSTSYAEGLRHGSSETYYPSGQRKKITHFINGELHGDEATYTASGQLIYSITYRQGRIY